MALDPRRTLPLVAAALLTSSLAVVTVLLALTLSSASRPLPEPFAYVGAGWAALSPLLAVLARGEGLVSAGAPRGGTPDQLAAWQRRQLVFFATLESGALLAALSLLATPGPWPVLAAALPLAAMGLNFPRGGA